KQNSLFTKTNKQCPGLCTWEDSDPVTLKKESNLPWVLPCLLFDIFLQPLRILSSLAYLNCFSVHMNWMRSSSEGSFHLRSTVAQSTTSGARKRRRASLNSQSSGGGLSRISSMEPCCLMRSMARLGPIPLMVPQ
uniref:Uncharacterized protein n=1 Tax=Gadus morhua TaxID=8049 RepID=A0A8C5BRZ7_GADMO